MLYISLLCLIVDGNQILWAFFDRCMGMELKRNYDTPEFHDDLRLMYMRAGVSYEDTVFLFTDTQITKEGFLEDINNMLNSGKF